MKTHVVTSSFKYMHDDLDDDHLYYCHWPIMIITNMEKLSTYSNTFICVDLINDSRFIIATKIQIIYSIVHRAYK